MWVRYVGLIRAFSDEFDYDLFQCIKTNMIVVAGPGAKPMGSLDLEKWRSQLVPGNYYSVQMLDDDYALYLSGTKLRKIDTICT